MRRVSLFEEDEGGMAQCRSGRNAGFALWSRHLAVGVILVLLAQACANVSDEGTLPVPDEVLSVASPEGVESSVVVSSGRDATIEVSRQVSDEPGARVVYRSDRVYLEGEVPPCSVDGGSGGDPCAPSSPSRRETKGVSASISGITELNFLTRLLGPDGLDTMGTHLVVRGVVQDDSTRCEAYPFILERYAPDDIKAGLPSLDRMYFYMCFADFIVSDYIIGEGPPLLTVALYGTYPSKASFDEAISSGISEEEHMDYPQTWTANEFEGKELVLFLTTPDTLAVETWFAIDIWFVQRNDKSDIIVTSRNIDFAINDEVRSQLIIPLEELVERVEKAVEERNILTEGRIGIDTRLPPAMTDAYELREFYEAAGAVYSTVEGATVLPPPVPGEGDPPPPTILTNEGTTSSSVPEPGEEPTAPPSTDDAGDPSEEEATTTVVDTTSTTTSTTEVTSTVTTTTEPVESTVVTEPVITETASTTTTTITTTTTTTTMVAGEEDVSPVADDGVSGGEEGVGEVTTLPVNEDTLPPIDDSNLGGDQVPGGQGDSGPSAGE